MASSSTGESRDQILEEFMNIFQDSGLDHGDCIEILETNGWNLERAVDATFKQLSGSPAAAGASSAPAQSSRSSPIIVDLSNDSDSDTTDMATPPVRVSSLQPRMVHFDIEYLNRTLHYELDESQTLEVLKRRISNDIGIPIHRLSFAEHRIKDVTDDKTVLRAMRLPIENRVVVISRDAASFMNTRSQRRPGPTFRFHIFYNNDQESFEAPFSGSMTINELLRDLSDVTGVSPRQQTLRGLPLAAQRDGTLTIAQAGFQQPVHELHIVRQEGGNRSRSHDRELPSSDDEFMDSQEDFGYAQEEAVDGTDHPLIPERDCNPTEALQCFANEFTRRYGDGIPPFFIGSLASAAQEAFQKTASHRKPLAIYLHHDRSFKTHIFCRNCIANQLISEYLALNYVTWAWDLTSEENRARFRAVYEEVFGQLQKPMMRSEEDLPVVFLVAKTGSTYMVRACEGDSNAEEALNVLTGFCMSYEEQREMEVRQESEREAREMLKREQDNAYEASLKVDREKAAAKQESERQKFLETKRVEDERIRIEELKGRLAAQVPLEPAEDAEDVTIIRIRLPSGEMLQRRFWQNDSLQNLLDFIGSKGFAQANFKLLRSWPRKDVSACDPSATFKQLSLVPQETLIVEERS